MRPMIAIAALAMLTAGCATYSWYRADTPPDVAARDQGECYGLARDSVRDSTFSAFPRLYGPSRTWPTLGLPWGDPYWGPTGDPLWRMDVEQRIQERCMRDRGYDLQRAPKA
jgi:hypothetical protein